jgi:hypothetical protein
MSVCKELLALLFHVVTSELDQLSELLGRPRVDCLVGMNQLCIDFVKRWPRDHVASRTRLPLPDCLEI